MTFRISYSKDGRIFMSGARPTTAQQAADDAASILADGATRVEIERVEVREYSREEAMRDGY